MKTNDQTFKSKLDPKIIESVWADHLLSCERCRFVVLDKPVTLANSCPEGAQYLKVIFEKERAPQIAARRKADNAVYKKAMGGTSGRVSKEKLKEVMKYK